MHSREGGPSEGMVSTTIAVTQVMSVINTKTVPRSDLSVEDREKYIEAVLCLQSKPSQADKKRFPVALSRYDDFVATHMTLAMQLHSTVSCLYSIAILSTLDRLTHMYSHTFSLHIATISGSMKRSCASNAVTRATSR